MVVIPSGRFTIGSPANEPGRDSDEAQRSVQVARFAAGLYEVTFAEWDACAADGGCKSNPRPSDAGWGRGRRPVMNVSWNDAQEYVAWLSRRTGQAYRLLTEAEWEYAARAGTSTRFWWGRNTSPRQAQYNWTYNGGPDFTAPHQTAEVGAFAANAFALYDVHGNVAEWVEDCYTGAYGASIDNGGAYVPSSCYAHVVRGGSWNEIPPELRSAERNYPPYGETRFWMHGLRVARSLEPSAQAPFAPRVIWADEPTAAAAFPHPIVSLMARNPHPPRGSAELDCLIEEEGRARCTLVREAPAGHDFGEAALSVVEWMRARPMLSDGVTPSAGARTQVTIWFPGPSE
jgi:formylglycine-generating enzyme required for sulfatase activity